MQPTLPTAEMACASLQQQKSQRNVLKHDKQEVEMSVMHTKGEKGGCTACGCKSHTVELTIAGHFWALLNGTQVQASDEDQK